MKVQYFEDTDTLYILFKNAETDERKDLDENALVEFDARENLVSMTVEHARERTASQVFCSSKWRDELCCLGAKSEGLRVTSF